MFKILRYKIMVYNFEQYWGGYNYVQEFKMPIFWLATHKSSNLSSKKKIMKTKTMAIEAVWVTLSNRMLEIRNGFMEKRAYVVKP